ncbi:MRG/MORF4L-binding protein [Agrilus planipennis]|uniref:MRG/MORF4L-binding protein n=1 Tax=Agrilus planipennis TaxID=224129 RepID=A0A1W4WL65_AGRPL|nr:MRG/MORF4L-binding protein [Agrilus planipennis]
MEDFEWNVSNEIHLLEAMVGHKPVGINKHFQMAVIWEKLTTNLNRDIPSEKIWSHLDVLYNLEALDDMEIVPFPNNEVDFYLPDAEYGVLKAKKEEKSEERKSLQKGRETPKMIKETKRDDKTGGKVFKEAQRRDSRDSGKDFKTAFSGKKEIKKDVDKSKSVKSRSSLSTHSRDEGKSYKSKADDTPRTAKRPTRGSLKPDDSGSSGKASPINTTPGGTKRRRT